MKKHNCAVQETEATQYLVTTYAGQADVFEKLADAKAAHKEYKRLYGVSDLRKVTVKTITIENSERIAK